MSSWDRAGELQSKPRPITTEDSARLKIGIVVSQWNEKITSRLLMGCMEILLELGVQEQRIEVLQVPGSFELIGGMNLLMLREKWDAVIGLGCVIKGETSHDEYINHAVAQGMVQLNIKYNTPAIFGLLTTDTMQQAEDRAGGQYGNKGSEAAETALIMARLYSNHSK